MKTFRSLLALLLALTLAVPSLTLGAAAETVEKPMATFSASNVTDQRLLYGTMFYTDWKNGDGLPNDNVAGKGADLSGTASNGAHIKMFLKATVTLTATDGNADTCWTRLGFRLRSGRVDSNEMAANFVYLTPSDLPMTGGVAEVSIPLSSITAGSIDWADVRQLNITCEVKDEYRLPTTGNSEVLTFALANVRIVREMSEGEVDTDELKDLVALTVDESAYRADAVAAFKEAQDAGRLVLENANATQEQVDEAVAAILQARTALMNAAITHTEVLQSLVEEDLSGDGYTADSYKAYTTAKTAGETVLADENATQRQINTAVLAIWKAKLGLAPTEPDGQYETVQTFSAANKSIETLLYGTTFHAGWSVGDKLARADTTGGGVDLSGDADNGAADDLYLQIKFVLPGYTADVDAYNGFRQISLRLRSSAVGGAEMACGVYYLKRELLTRGDDGVYTVRLPLRLFSKGKIDWTDVKEVFVTAEVNQPLYVTDDSGKAVQGISDKVGFAMGDVAIVRKDAVAVSLGDVDGDGDVTAADALLALQASTDKVELTAAQQQNANVDGQAGVTAADALMILQASTGKIALPAATARKMVAFTFDDSPTEYTADFLDELKARNAHITFFIVGTYAEQYPELVTRMAAEGHSVGNHSYTHTKNLTQIDEASMKEEIDKCNALIEELTGKAPVLFRAPWAATDERSEAYLTSLGMRIIGWVGYGYPDHELSDKEDILKHHRAEDGRYTVTDGDILIFHSTRPSSMEAVLDIIDSLQEQGYDIVSVEELLGARLGGGVAGGKYERAIELG